MASLFVALVLIVGKFKEEVYRVMVTCVDLQWLLGLEEIVEHVVLGVGIEMGKEPWIFIGGGESFVHPPIV